MHLCHAIAKSFLESTILADFYLDPMYESHLLAMIFVIPCPPSLERAILCPALPAF